MKAEQIILQFIRGEKSWRQLLPLGITISFERGGLLDANEITSIEGPVILPADACTGMLHHLKVPQELREWAAVFTGPCPWDIDEEYEDDPTWDEIYGAIYGAAFGDPPTKAIIELAKKIVKEQS